MSSSAASFDDAVAALLEPLNPKYEHIWMVLRLHKGSYHPEDTATLKQAGMDGFQIVSTVGQPSGGVVVFMTRRIS